MFLHLHGAWCIFSTPFGCFASRQSFFRTDEMIAMHLRNEMVRRYGLHTIWVLRQSPVLHTFHYRRCIRCTYCKDAKLYVHNLLSPFLFCIHLVNSITKKISIAVEAQGWMDIPWLCTCDAYHSIHRKKVQRYGVLGCKEDAPETVLHFRCISASRVICTPSEAVWSRFPTVVKRRRYRVSEALWSDWGQPRCAGRLEMKLESHRYKRKFTVKGWREECKRCVKAQGCKIQSKAYGVKISNLQSKGTRVCNTLAAEES